MAASALLSFGIGGHRQDGAEIRLLGVRGGMRRSYRTPGLGGVVPRALLWAGIRCPVGTRVGGE